MSSEPRSGVTKPTGGDQPVGGSRVPTSGDLPVRGKQGGSMDTPTSTKSNIVQPAPGGPKVQDPGITNKGT